MLSGYMNQILWVDLSEQKTWIQQPSESLLTDFIGGYGIGVRILYEQLQPGIDPLGSENILGFCTGPFTGTPTIEGNRFMVVCKSPLTGGWGDANCGGSFGPYLKFAGFDAVFFKGKAKSPLYLLIDNGNVSLIDAGQLWGLDTTETEELLKRNYGADCRIVSIGPAGENLSLIAAIIHNGRAAARSGVGAVMGSKNLKAIVVKGNQEVPLADRVAVNQLKQKYIKLPSREYYPMTETGTIGVLGSAIMSGDSPVKNWGGVGLTDFPSGIEKFSKDKVMKYQTKRKGCWRCTIACSGEMEVKEGPYVIHTEKVEYESAAAFGPMILNDNFESIVYINDLCNRLGLDTISAGSVIAFAMECSENKLMPDKDLEISWGDSQKTIKYLQKMAKREGAFSIFTDGVKKATEAIGVESQKYAMHINGQELPFHDPRFQPGMATTYATEPTPGRHCPCEWILPPGLDLPKDFERYSPHGKGELQKQLTSLMQMVNSSGLCQMAYYSYPVFAWPEFLQAVTGVNWDLEKFKRTGERILNLRHVFNLREGLNPLQYKVPDRVIGKPPLKEGNTKDVSIDLEMQRTEYYKALDWDIRTSRPSDEKLTALGLGFVIKDLK